MYIVTLYLEGPPCSGEERHDEVLKEKSEPWKFAHSNLTSIKSSFSSCCSQLAYEGEFGRTTTQRSGKVRDRRSKNR